ncbi:hypothetical protein [Stenotrophomonas acidaminiphila]
MQSSERFRISQAMVKTLRRLAHGQKGLDYLAEAVRYDALANQATGSIEP